MALSFALPRASILTGLLCIYSVAAVGVPVDGSAPLDSASQTAVSEATEQLFKAQHGLERGSELIHKDIGSDDFLRGRELLENAAASGNADAQFQLGFLHVRGMYNESRVSDLRSALPLFEACAEQGFGPCQQVLAVLYAHGVGVPRDDARAVLLLTFAAAAGEKRAIGTLAYRYHRGVGVPADCRTAARYYERLADKVAVAVRESGQPVDAATRDLNAEADGTTNQPPQEHEHDVVQYYEYTAGQGNVDAKYQLGSFYYQGGQNVPQDTGRAAEYLQQAADAGHAEAQGMLGQFYLNGIGVQADNETARQLLERAADAGVANGLVGYGYMLQHGIGVERDSKRAFEMYLKAAQKGAQDGMFNVGTMYLAGEGVKQDVGEALKWFKKAAGFGHILAMYQVARIELAQGTEALCQSAITGYKTLIERGLWHDSLSEAFAEYDDGKYESALFMLLELAELGVEPAQFNAAFLVDRELAILDFVEPRASIAERLYRSSAQQGNIAAMIKVGDMLYDDNPREAARWYERASTGGNAHASFNLGQMHANGVGVSPDYHLAKRYYDRSMSQSKTTNVAASLALAKLSYDAWMGKYGSAAAAEGAASAEGSERVAVLPNWLGSLQRSVAEVFAGYEAEDIALVALSVAFAAVVYVRAQRLE